MTSKIEIGTEVIDLFGRKCRVIKLREMKDSEGRSAWVATLVTLSTGDLSTRFEQHVGLLRHR